MLLHQLQKIFGEILVKLIIVTQRLTKESRAVQQETQTTNRLKQSKNNGGKAVVISLEEAENKRPTGAECITVTLLLLIHKARLKC